MFEVNAQRMLDLQFSNLVMVSVFTPSNEINLDENKVRIFCLIPTLSDRQPKSILIRIQNFWFKKVD